MPADRLSFHTWAGYGASAVLLLIVIQQHYHIATLEVSPATDTVAPLGSARPKSPLGSSASPTPRSGLHDARTQSLLDELQSINQSAIAGQVHEPFQNKAWELLFDNDADRRSRNFGLLLDVLRPEDGVALHDLFNKMHQEGRDYPDEYARFASRWGQVDGAGALRFYFVEAKIAPAPADVHNVLKGWAQEHPGEALAWAVANREMVNAKPHATFGPQTDPVTGVLRGWARTDLVAATAAMKAQFPDPAQREQAINTMYVESLFGNGLQPTLDWIKQLPDGPEDPNQGGRAALQNLFRRIRDAGTPPEKVVATLIDVAGQPWFGLEDLMGVSHTFRKNASDFANAFTAPEAQPVLQTKFEAWSGQHPEAMSAWLNGNRGTVLYDLGAAELARSLRTSDPDASAIWANTIRDPSLKVRASGG